MEKSNIYDFLRIEIDKALKDGLFKNENELAEKAGTFVSNLNRFRKGTRTSITFDTAYNLLKALNFDIKKNEIVESEKATIKRLGSFSPAEEINQDEKGLIKINIYQATSAGNPFMLQENEPITSIFINELYAKQADMAFLVDGESMYPTVKDSAIVGVSLNKQFLSNEIFAINHPDGGVTIKRVSVNNNNWVIRSDNPDQVKYPQQEFSQQEYPNLIIGRVVWVWQKM